MNAYWQMFGFGKSLWRRNRPYSCGFFFPIVVKIANIGRVASDLMGRPDQDQWRLFLFVS